MSEKYEPYAGDQALAGPNAPPMKTIMDLIRYCITVHHRFGNTCVECAGLQWGGSALNAKSRLNDENSILRDEIIQIRYQVGQFSIAANLTKGQRQRLREIASDSTPSKKAQGGEDSGVAPRSTDGSDPVQWPEGFVDALFTLLDRIEIEEDYTLASQRHGIAEEYGLTVVFGEQVSGRMN